MNWMQLRRRVASKPYDYKVKYIASTGTQYLYIPTNDVVTKIEIEFKFTQKIAQQRVIRCGTDNGGLNIYNSGQGYIAASMEGDWTSSGLHALTRCRVEMDAVNKTTIITTENGGTVSLSHKQATIRKDIYLFTGGAYCVVRSCKAYHNNDIICDLIPVSKNNVGYMYDRVSRRLYGNAGTDNFIVGPIVDTKPYDYALEYIEATNGSMAIDTGIKLLNSYSFGLTFMPLNDVSRWVLLFGYRYQGQAIQYQLNYYINKPILIDYGNTTVHSGVNVVLSEWFDASVICLGENTKRVDVNGVEGAETTLPQQDDSKSMTAYLFSSHQPAGVENRGQQVRCSKAWIKNANGELLIDLIPVEEDLEGCMYDLVSGKIFRNINKEAQFTMGRRL